MSNKKRLSELNGFSDPFGDLRDILIILIVIIVAIFIGAFLDSNISHDSRFYGSVQLYLSTASMIFNFFLSFL